MAYTWLFQKEDTVANFNGITTGTGAITLTSGNFTVSGTQLFVIDADTVNAEVVKATVSGTTLTLTARAQDNTSAVTHTAGCKIGMYAVPSHYANGLGVVAANDVGTTWSTTYTGFSSNPTQVITYLDLGKWCFVNIGAANAAGTSNATTFTMTMPHNAKRALQLTIGRGTDNTSDSKVVRGDLAAGSNVLTLYTDAAAAAWTNTGTKGVSGSLIFEAE